MKWQLSVKIIILHLFPLTKDVIIQCFLLKLALGGSPRRYLRNRKS